MNLLCKIGLHKWITHYTRGRMFLHAKARRCSRCGKKQTKDDFYGWVTDDERGKLNEQEQKNKDFIYGK